MDGSFEGNDMQIARYCCPEKNQGASFPSFQLDGVLLGGNADYSSNENSCKDSGSNVGPF